MGQVFCPTCHGGRPGSSRTGRCTGATKRPRWGAMRRRRQRSLHRQARTMFDIVMIVLVILSLGFPVAPWICGARRGLRGVWFSTALALVSLLGCFRSCSTSRAAPAGRAPLPSFCWGRSGSSRPCSRSPRPRWHISGSPADTSKRRRGDRAAMAASVQAFERMAVTTAAVRSAWWPMTGPTICPDPHSDEARRSVRTPRPSSVRPRAEACEPVRPAS